MVFHFLIPFGAGHGILCLGLLEILFVPEMIQNGFKPSPGGFSMFYLAAFILCSILGQIMLIASILAASERKKTVLHITGLVLLWISIYFVTQAGGANQEIAFSFFACIPLFICTLLPFLKTPASKLND